MGEAKPKLGRELEVGSVGSRKCGGEVGRCFMGEEVAVRVGVGRGGESVLAVFEHGVGIRGGEMARLSTQVEENGVQLPPAQGVDGGLVNAGDEESGGAARTEAVGFDAVWGDVGDVVNCGSGTLECGGDIAGGDVVREAGRVEVMVQGGVRGAVVGMEVGDAAP